MLHEGFLRDFRVVYGALILPNSPFTFLYTFQKKFKSSFISTANLKKLFANLEKATTQNEKDKLLSDLQPVITYASIAVDECDFGTGLEVGIALFCSGLKELQPSSLSSLSAAYSVLNRTSFIDIIKVIFVVISTWKLVVLILV